ncbi:taurine ABC transporter substrate-binding protein [Rhizobium sp. KVB221]|uniref:Taurine ABC transporter substrate-binding protein n=1 Tax=Rhizobium setariae TaxID=2801340 RepID=A0A937CQE3_9HYPH|nr:taurine ABC transporter substrate-binding protein [Rhizobium setariae]MBL0374349.1 taurine ABC transporter substrate-binding protein [Rhizobium setariae]
MKSIRSTTMAGMAILLSLPLAHSAEAEQKVVNIAYQLTPSPWVARIADKSFEAQTGYTINWRQFNTGAEIISAMASGSIDISVLGSSPLAVAASAGLDIKLFWILEDIASAEALYVRNDAGINKPADLAGKKLAVPFASTSHYQLMYALERWGVEGEATILNLDPNKAAAAWERKDIDGAFIWGAAMARLKRDGKPLATAGEICQMGRCTFEGMVASTSFAEQNGDFMRQFVGIINATNQDYKENTRNWGAESDNVKLISNLFGADAETVAEDMSQYKYPSLSEQLSCSWLGCAAEGGGARTLKLTADFLKSQGKIGTVLDNYSGFITDEFIGRAE